MVTDATRIFANLPEREGVEIREMIVATAGDCRAPVSVDIISAMESLFRIFT